MIRLALTHSCPSELKKTVYDSYEKKASSSKVNDVYGRLENLRVPISHLLNMIDVQTRGKLILDVGTGWGVVAIAAAKKFQNAIIIGLDFSSACLRLARDAVRELELTGRVGFIRADAEAMPLRDAIADILVSQATLNLVPDKSRAFSELARMSKNSSILIISDAITKGKIGEESPELWCQCVTGALTMRELERVMKLHGLEIKETRDLTAIVRDLVKTEKWDWPEFLKHDLTYVVVKARKG